ncbi:MAG: BMP family ABC transporter substrate-binding protein [Clostridiaceae bacterium]|nr:BMP family ABC transporter substrate-binding protein [Clostridiaceae bacterium]
MRKRFKSLFGLVLAVLCLTMVLTGCDGQGGANNKEEKVKVGFVYIGSAEDKGYTYAHDQGRLYLQEKLGDKVEILYQENVSDADNSSVAVMQSLIDQGCTIIFANSYGYMDYMHDIAQDYPDVTFLHCSGSKSADNMLNYFGRIYQPRYLSGIVAGMKTETNKIGYVAAYPIPEVVRGINAFTLGVRSVNPDATVEVVWTSTWYDPATEKQAAIALLDNNCDVIAQHQDTTGPQQAAESRGKWSIGYNCDTSEVAAKSYMTAPVWNWGPYYAEQVQKVIDGTWKPENYWGGMEDGIVALAPLTANAPEGAQEKVDEMTAKIMSGEFKVFQGPIKDQSGNIRVPEGTELTDEEMLSIDWFVEGVVGTISSD